MDLRTGRQVLINRQIDELMDRLTGEQINRQIDGLMDRLTSTDKQIDRWTDLLVYSLTAYKR